jgi:hypothetical protein
VVVERVTGAWARLRMSQFSLSLSSYNFWLPRKFVCARFNGGQPCVVHEVVN